MVSYQEENMWKVNKMEFLQNKTRKMKRDTLRNEELRNRIKINKLQEGSEIN
jgi:hypothetical protein